MTTSLGLCQNVDHCNMASKKRPIATDIDQPFVCPECHGALVAPPVAQPARRGFAMVTTASVGVLALAGLGVGWSFRNGSAPAITPAAASTPAATAASLPVSPAPQPPAPQPSAPQPAAPAEAASVPAIAAPAPAHMQTAVATPAPEQPASVPPPAAPSSAAVLFRLNGATAMQLQLMPKLAAAYLTNVGDGAVAATKDAAGHQITVTGSRGSAREQIIIDATSSNQSFASLQDKSSDIAVSTRHIKPAETQSIAAVDAQGEPHEAVIALDGIAIVVNPANTVSTLTLDQLRGIYSGSITNWSQVGGAPLPIRLWTRNESSGTYDLFNSVALRGTAMTSRARPSDDDAEIANNVAQDDGAIGYVSQAHIGLSKAVAIAATGTGFTRPSAASIATEEYPFTRRLYIYTPANAANSFAARFADFVQSAPG